MAGNPPAALGAPGKQHRVSALPVPELGGKLPPSTAKLAVPPRSICMVPAEVKSDPDPDPAPPHAGLFAFQGGLVAGTATSNRSCHAILL